jgi:hypothetical protein
MTAPIIKFKRESSGQWTATYQTPTGPVTGVGDTREGAQRALVELVAISRAIELSRRPK